MGCWGKDIACNDEFWDNVSALQETLEWDKYDGNPESMITAKHFNEHHDIIEGRIRKGFLKFESCWFHVVAFVVMKIGARMSMEMRGACMLACRIENDYLDPNAWVRQSDLADRALALKNFEQEIDEYYCSQVVDQNIERDY